MSDQQIPPMDEPPFEETPPPAEQALPVDAERGQRGPASTQTGAEQTGVDDTASAPQPGAPAAPQSAPSAPQPGAPAAPQQSAPAAPQGGAAPQQGETIGAGSGPADGPVKDPEDWVTGDQPMTDAQRSFLDSLARQAGEQLPADLTKAEASEHIDRLQAATGRDQQQGGRQG